MRLGWCNVMSLLSYNNFLSLARASTTLPVSFHLDPVDRFHSSQYIHVFNCGSKITHWSIGPAVIVNMAKSELGWEQNIKILGKDFSVVKFPWSQVGCVDQIEGATKSIHLYVLVSFPLQFKIGMAKNWPSPKVWYEHRPKNLTESEFLSLQKK